MFEVWEFSLQESIIDTCAETTQLIDGNIVPCVKLEDVNFDVSLCGNLCNAAPSRVDYAFDQLCQTITHDKTQQGAFKQPPVHAEQPLASDYAWPRGRCAASSCSAKVPVFGKGVSPWQAPPRTLAAEICMGANAAV